MSAVPQRCSKAEGCQASSCSCDQSLLLPAATREILWRSILAGGSHVSSRSALRSVTLPTGS